MRDIQAINPALVAELFDGEREQFLINLEAEVNLSALDVFFGQMLTLVTPVKINSRPRAGTAATTESLSLNFEP
jgi:hypothetical protein